MEKVRRAIEVTCRIFQTFAKICLAAMAALVACNVIFRLTPIGPISGTFELTGYLCAFLTAFALGHNQVIRGNIAVEFLVSRLSRRTQAALDALVFSISAILCIIISWRCVHEAIDMSKTGEVSPTLSIPFFPVFLVIAVGIALLAIVFITDTFKAISGVLEK